MLCLPVAAHVKLFKDGHILQAYDALGLSKALDEEVVLLPRWTEGPDEVAVMMTDRL